MPRQVSGWHGETCEGTLATGGLSCKDQINQHTQSAPSVQRIVWQRDTLVTECPLHRLAALIWLHSQGLVAIQEQWLSLPAQHNLHCTAVWKEVRAGRPSMEGKAVPLFTLWGPGLHSPRAQQSRLRNLCSHWGHDWKGGHVKESSLRYIGVRLWLSLESILKEMENHWRFENRRQINKRLLARGTHCGI